MAKKVNFTSGKVRLIKNWEGNRKGKIVRVALWKGRELIKDGYAIEYDGFLADGENADDQDKHDKLIAAQVKAAHKQEVTDKASGNKLIGE